MDEKRKLCWNCEGSVSLEDESCPYCGVTVIPASLDGDYYAPPYKFSSNAQHDIPKSPYAVQESNEPQSVPSAPAKGENEAPFVEFKRVIIATALLLTGSVFFLFGLALVLFSQDGHFTLQWDAEYWFIYSALSLPLLLFGWRALLNLDQE